MNKLRFLVIGDLPLATHTLRLLMRDPWIEVPCVLTQYKDRIFTNDPWCDSSSLYEEARRLKIPIYHSPCDLQREKPAGYFDFGVSCRASIIYKSEFLDLFKNFLVNMHGGLLPERAGVHIACHTIIQGDQRSGGTLHVIDSGIDTGDILSRREFPVENGDTAFNVYQKSQLVLLDLFQELLPHIKAGSYQRTPQSVLMSKGHAHAYFPKKAIEEFREINIQTMSPEEIDKRVRGLEFPGHEPAYMRLNGKKIYLSTRYANKDERNR